MKKTNEHSSEDMIVCMDSFKEEYPDYIVIDITDRLTSEGMYKSAQIANYKSKTIMVAEKNEETAEVFETRVNSETSNMIVMYNGSFRTFEFALLENTFDSLCEMIDG